MSPLPSKITMGMRWRIFGGPGYSDISPGVMMFRSNVVLPVPVIPEDDSLHHPDTIGPEPRLSMNVVAEHHGALAPGLAGQLVRPSWEKWRAEDEATALSRRARAVTDR